MSLNAFMVLSTFFVDVSCAGSADKPEEGVMREINSDECEVKELIAHARASEASKA
ncbi:MAG: hypothetical protein IPJ71_06835 [Bdellovibrionales bacterium]|nr:hypothetical protein [Bdellovibrionales bacterium]